MTVTILFESKYSSIQEQRAKILFSQNLYKNLNLTENKKRNTKAIILKEKPQISYKKETQTIEKLDKVFEYRATFVFLLFSFNTLVIVFCFCYFEKLSFVKMFDSYLIFFADKTEKTLGILFKNYSPYLLGLFFFYLKKTSLGSMRDYVETKQNLRLLNI